MNSTAQIFKRTRMGLLVFAALTMAQIGCSSKSSGNAGPGTPISETTIKAPVSIPVIADGTIPSPDRVTMDGVLKRAAQENKMVILEISAAWCGPCAMFSTDLEAHPEDIKDLTDSGYILVRGEGEKFVNGHGLNLMEMNDFVPAFIPYYPSFFIYDGQTWKGIGSFNAYKDLADALKNGAKEPPFSFAELQAFLQKAPGAANKTDSQRFQTSVFGGFAENYTYSQAKAALSLMAANKAYGDMVGFVKSLFPIYVAAGAVTAARLVQDFPDDGKSITDPSSGYAPYVFAMQLSVIWRSQGLKQAVAQCNSVWLDLRGQMVPGKLSASDFQTKLQLLDAHAAVTCADLEYRADGATDVLKQKVASIDKTKNGDWALFEALGDRDTAVSLYHERFATYLDSYNKDIASLNKDLQAANAAGDKSKADDLTKELAIRNWQIQYHTKLDADVEATLKAGQPVKVLEVEN